MMFGRVDRSGKRESSKSSLRSNKQEAAKKLKELAKGHKPSESKPTKSETPPPATATDASLTLMDCAVQLLNRQFDRDQLKVIQRAVSSGVLPMVAWASDFGKLEQLVRLARENSGSIYCMVGVHSDMIQRNNDKLSTQRLEELRAVAMKPEVVAILAGLDFSRDVGIRYAQQKALQQQLELAASVQLPMVLYHERAAEALVEAITEWRAAGGEAAVNTPIAILNFSGSTEEMMAFLELGCYIILNSYITETSDRAARLRDCMPSLPLSRLLLASDAPFNTPQNIQDAFMRQARNEPSNLPALFEYVSQYYPGHSSQELAQLLKQNSLTFFGIPEDGCQSSHGRDASACTSAAPALTLSIADNQTSADGATSTDSQEGHGGSRQQAPQSSNSQDSEDDDSDTEQETAQPTRATNLFAAIQSVDEAESSSEVTEPEVEEDSLTSRRSGHQQQHASASQQPGSTTRQRAAPRNFVAEYQAAAAAKGPVQGPRITYACRQCRSVLLEDADVLEHVGAEELAKVEFRRAQRTGKSGRRGKEKWASTEHLCSLHFLRVFPQWHQAQVEDSSAVQGASGKLQCPTCQAKLGKFVITDAAGIQCSCGVLVPAPAYAILRARLDIIDAELDIAQAVQSTLQLYEQEDGQDYDTGSSDEGGSRKKRPTKVKQNKTANFSSFRNKSYGVSVKKDKAEAQKPSSKAKQQHMTGNEHLTGLSD